MNLSIYFGLHSRDHSCLEKTLLCADVFSQAFLTRTHLLSPIARGVWRGAFASFGMYCSRFQSIHEQITCLRWKRRDLNHQNSQRSPYVSRHLHQARISYPLLLSHKRNDSNSLQPLLLQMDLWLKLCVKDQPAPLTNRYCPDLGLLRQSCQTASLEYQRRMELCQLQKCIDTLPPPRHRRQIQKMRVNLQHTSQDSKSSTFLLFL
mmetsp:Transcript_6302/g.10652  ORF Transcript_6302/g.10652 Transcript_6302/m.10652 type:complete len:206 (+) Transcript_6302:2226-2843(+)